MGAQRREKCIPSAASVVGKGYSHRRSPDGCDLSPSRLFPPRPMGFRGGEQRGRRSGEGIRAAIESWTGSFVQRGKGLYMSDLADLDRSGGLSNDQTGG